MSGAERVWLSPVCQVLGTLWSLVQTRGIFSKCESCPALHKCLTGFSVHPRGWDSMVSPCPACHHVTGSSSSLPSSLLTHFLCLQLHVPYMFVFPVNTCLFHWSPFPRESIPCYPPYSLKDAFLAPYLLTSSLHSIHFNFCDLLYQAQCLFCERKNVGDDMTALNRKVWSHRNADINPSSKLPPFPQSNAKRQVQ